MQAAGDTTKAHLLKMAPRLERVKMGGALLTLSYLVSMPQQKARNNSKFNSILLPEWMLRCNLSVNGHQFFDCRLLNSSFFKLKLLNILYCKLKLVHELH